MNSAFIKAIIILPGTALVYIPALVVYFTRNTPYAATFPPDSIFLWLATLLFAVAGLCLMIWAMILFNTKGGGGTPAPWQPIQNLIILGPYRYVRNPMLSGVNLFLVAEALALQSLPVFIWGIVFVVLNTIYFVKLEEPELEKRYGAAYTRYKNGVPRWIPRLTPYQGEEEPHPE